MNLKTNFFWFIVTIRRNTPDRTFIGVHLLAEDDKNSNVGSWKTADLSLQSASCGGLMHASKLEKTRVDATWHPSSNVAGDITIKYRIFFQTQ